MMSLFPDILRAAITDIMLIILLSTMATPKYKNKRAYLLVATVLLVGNVGANCIFYLTSNYTAVLQLNLVTLLVIGIALKPFFSDTIMQWCFSYMTMLNIHVAVVFLSYKLSRFLPYPMYGISLLRLLLFSLVVFVFRRWVSMPYRRVLEYWHIFLLPVLSLLVCLLAFLAGGDVVRLMDENDVPLLLLIMLGLSVYVSIIHSLTAMTKHYAMREENRRMQAEREFLQLAAGSMSQRLTLMEEVSAQNSRSAHDRRHFNHVLLELLEKGNSTEAANLLKSQSQATPKINRVYCENPAVNAAVCHYAGLAEQAGIPAEISLDIPNNLPVDALELAMVVSNLMENAIAACVGLPQERPPFLRFHCQSVGRLLLEMSNPCQEGTALDTNGHPVAHDAGHGIGSKCVIAFAKKHDSELQYHIEHGVFRVRLLI